MTAIFGILYRASDECLILLLNTIVPCQTEFTCSKRWYIYNTEFLLEKAKI
jgi:hypothetical protein